MLQVAQHCHLGGNTTDFDFFNFDTPFLHQKPYKKLKYGA